MGNVDWGCLAVQVAITGIAFFLINMLILYKDVDGKVTSIRRDDMNLFLSLLLSILVGYWATTYVKPDCVSVPYTKQEGKEKFYPGFDITSGDAWKNLGSQFGSVGSQMGNQIASPFVSGWNTVSSGAQDVGKQIENGFKSMYR